MTHIVKLACSCGKVTGEVKIVPKDNFHVTCLCCDCQSFAKHLGHEDTVLDQHGGTELFQTYPAYLSITQGAEYIASLRLTPKGILRHYTTCCNTPIGNVMNGAKIPFVGIPVQFMQFSDACEKETILGPQIMKAFAKYAKNGKPEDAHDRFPLSFLPKIFAFMVKGYLQKKYSPSPFFKAEKPVTTPLILSQK